jgi:ubiquinone/menaquinone biosynthesis C-methylase UbiE
VRVKHSFTRQDVKSPIKARSADVYAAFLRRHIRPDMAVLDYGCGEGTIAVGLAEAVPEGRVVGVDLAERNLLSAHRYATSLGLGNLFWCAADASRLPFCDAQFHAVLCRSMLETVDTPIRVVSELRRVTKYGGLDRAGILPRPKRQIPIWLGITVTGYLTFHGGRDAPPWC